MHMLFYTEIKIANIKRIILLLNRVSIIMYIYQYMYIDHRLKIKDKQSINSQIM